MDATSLLATDESSVRLLHHVLGSAGVPMRFWETILAGAVATGITVGDMGTPYIMTVVSVTG